MSRAVQGFTIFAFFPSVIRPVLSFAFSFASDVWYSRGVLPQTGRSPPGGPLELT